jgi:hypothetical protein
MKLISFICFLFAFFFQYFNIINCELNDESAIDSGTYSIQFISSLSGEVEYQILVNEVNVAEGTESVTPPASRWINFNASPNDVINVLIMNIDYKFHYLINNAASGLGTDIYDSRTTHFTPANICTDGTCEFTLIAPDFDGSTLNVYANDLLVLANFEGGDEVTFNASAGDVIRMDFTYGNGSTDVLYYFGITGGEILIAWMYDAYGTYTIIPQSTINPNRPPFGGQYYPITSEQASSFASTIGGGHQNSAWIPLTLPIN